jgi:hypothetical protein
MGFELWDVDGANLVGFFATEAEALSVVREMVDTYGVESVATYVLSSIDRNGTRDVLADGHGLAQRAAISLRPLTAATSTA